MIIALYALALAMIVGGLFAAILGWDIVLVERGWTMVISGIIGASSGALLIGITAVVSRLARIQEELARVQLSLEDEIETVVVPTPAAQARGRILEDVASAAAGALAGGLFGSRGAAATEPTAETRQDDTAPLDEQEPDEKARQEEAEASAPFEPRPAAAEEQAEPTFARERDDVSEGKVPDFLFAERYRETVVTEVHFPEREPSFSDEQPPAEEPAVDHEDVFEPEEEPLVEAAAADESEPTEPSEGPATVIGTYNSGDNKYVMFSDGSIEAETPQGFFRFGSLDELKEFIAAGGEGNSSAST
ncbi:hypothetical protein [Microvirga brassicacearum]|uniref:DUF308 domain-containing protein n=1 Tax=Microvirga brassicacearum TaxID=2580413 RepID=A0A5N3P6I5_9HYPH|nr:hypothetical protein [Microvirga brassicacearum]KAB0265271.1 hypothetical protein FEZ63_19315 [Microvirga brassicacearum]